ncbi:MAG: NAD(P)/FAD-dependent oxidoreductase [Nocardioides sp.]|uniref:flavin-containing monooxygenase n=1 Tax=Nocardioides sp. TaxID=35761 RepID=UPI0039E5D3E5
MGAEIEQVDVLVVGAGLSGIGAAAQVRERLPGLSVVVLEARAASGGTWDLFRYPGIRSDSDMFTFGYRWRPWPGEVALADGQMILDYLRTVAEEYDVDRLIRYRHRVTAAAWDSTEKRWCLTVTTPEGERRLAARFLWNCSGYYDYEQGHQPTWDGMADFEGTLVHPQHWPEELDYADKSVVVIGSGATAVTLVPAMASGDGRAAQVVMLQRSPSYILSRPGRDPLARLLSGTLGRLPKAGPLGRLAGGAIFESTRWANIMLTIGSYQLARKSPGVVRRMVRDSTRKLLTRRGEGPGFGAEEAEALVSEHFTPSYDPWDQRLCFVPDGDLFAAMREGRASVVTDRIKTFTAKGIELESGRTLEADIVVSATGLRIKLFGGIELSVDGESVRLPETMSYKALMLSGVPNFAYTIGYTNASWTLKADLVSDYVCRLLAHMDSRGYREARVERDPAVGERPFMDLASGYIQRALDLMPAQGDRAPWRLKQNYLTDLRVMGRPVDDGVLRFS